MLQTVVREARPAAVLMAALTLVTGVLYPGVVTGIAQAVFPAQANGSLVERQGSPVGSELIGQGFTSPRYFWSRPSACGYNAAASSGSNLAMSNPALVDAVRQRVADMRTSDTLNAAPVPVDLVLASGSGLDPHISVEAALWQVPRIARERAIAEEKVRAVVAEATEGRTFGILGEPRVNVLNLNLLLDAASETQ